MNNNLPAILGGTPTNKIDFKNANYIGKEEKKAVNRVLKSGILSGFVGAWVPEFYGGKEVKNLEKNWSKYFRVKHSISMNSATSGLIAAIGALDIQPGDEVIISMWGESNSRNVKKINRDGQIFVDNIGILELGDKNVEEAKPKSFIIKPTKKRPGTPQHTLLTTTAASFRT